MGKKTTTTSTSNTDSSTKPTSASKTAVSATAKTAGKKSGTKKVKAAPEPAADLKFKYTRLPRAPLLRIVKDMAHEVDEDARVQAQLLDHIEYKFQEWMADIVRSTVMTAASQKRKTMMVKDLDLVGQIRGDKNDVSSFSRSSQAAGAAVTVASD